MAEKKIALSIMAHPDDAEFMCAGTMALLKENGWEIHIATMTAGDCGSADKGAEEISAIRRGENVESAKLLGGSYHCLECEDVFIMYDKPTLTKAIELIRNVRPTVVFTQSTDDYMVDHTTTSKIAMTACFAAGIPNISTDSGEPFGHVPHLYYADAMEGRGILGDEIRPGLIVDISGVIEMKEKMLCCHESQRSWLMEHHGMDEYIDSMKRFSQDRGAKIKCEFGEGFRLHMGHAFPHDNILEIGLEDLVH